MRAIDRALASQRTVVELTWSTRTARRSPGCIAAARCCRGRTGNGRPSDRGTGPGRSGEARTGSSGPIGSIYDSDPDRVAQIIRETAARELVPKFITLTTAEIGEKSPGDFVTAVDLAMEEALAKALVDLLPGSLVVGEEAVHDDRGVLAVLDGDAPSG